MDTKDVDVKRTGSWLPFYCWLAGAVIEGLLIWLLWDDPLLEEHNGNLVEDILVFWLRILFLFLFLIGPAWMFISSIFYWRSKDYPRAVIGVLLALTIFSVFFQCTTL